MLVCTSVLFGLHVYLSVCLLWCAEMGHNSVQYLHHLIEALRLSFEDARFYIADPAKQAVPVNELLSKAYARERAGQITADK